MLDPDKRDAIPIHQRKRLTYIRAAMLDAFLTTTCVVLMLHSPSIWIRCICFLIGFTSSFLFVANTYAAYTRHMCIRELRLMDEEDDLSFKMDYIKYERGKDQ